MKASSSSSAAPGWMPKSEQQLRSLVNGSVTRATSHFKLVPITPDIQELLKQYSPHVAKLLQCGIDLLILQGDQTIVGSFMPTISTEKAKDFFFDTMSDCMLVPKSSKESTAASLVLEFATNLSKKYAIEKDFTVWYLQNSNNLDLLAAFYAKVNQITRTGANISISLSELKSVGMEQSLLDRLYTKKTIKMAALESKTVSKVLPSLSNEIIQESKSKESVQAKVQKVPTGSELTAESELADSFESPAANNMPWNNAGSKEPFQDIATDDSVVELYASGESDFESESESDNPKFSDLSPEEKIEKVLQWLGKLHKELVEFADEPELTQFDKHLQTVRTVKKQLKAFNDKCSDLPVELKLAFLELKDPLEIFLKISRGVFLSAQRSEMIFEEIITENQDLHDQVNRLIAENQDLRDRVNRLIAENQDLHDQVNYYEQRLAELEEESNEIDGNDEDPEPEEESNEVDENDKPESSHPYDADGEGQSATETDGSEEDSDA